MLQPCGMCGTFHAQDTPCLPLQLDRRVGMGLTAGTLLAGRYEIVSTIHQGGMSIVYLASDRFRYGQRVAIKELRLAPDATAEEQREAEHWFGREASLLSTLSHTLIPRFLGIFRESQRSYLVQEYIEGQNLDELVARFGPVSEPQVLVWGAELCRLLCYLHELPEPVIFRDLKPANVLVCTRRGPEGQVALRVVDFGIARYYQAHQTMTVIGTPGYAPPEQYQGLSTPQSDVYALGATLHRLLTGYGPEQGPPFTFPPVRSLNPQVSPELAAVVEQAVALVPAQRITNVAALRRTLLDLILAADAQSDSLQQRTHRQPTPPARPGSGTMPGAAATTAIASQSTATLQLQGTLPLRPRSLLAASLVFAGVGVWRSWASTTTRICSM